MMEDLDNLYKAINLNIIITNTPKKKNLAMLEIRGVRLFQLTSHSASPSYSTLAYFLRATFLKHLHFPFFFFFNPFLTYFSLFFIEKDI